MVRANSLVACKNVPLPRTPVLFVEAKWSDAPVERGLRYLKERFPDVPAWQIAATGTKDYVDASGIRVAPALALLSTLV